MVNADKNRLRRVQKQKLSAFSRHLLAEWRRLGATPEGAPLIIAVSGGADSTALLLAFDELLKAGRLACPLIVAHLDHGLRGKAGADDALWVAELARALGHEIRQGSVSVRQLAAEAADNLEQTARRARYEFLEGVARECAARAVLSAHTVDDQAETVLLRLLRGSGADGLSGIEPVRALRTGSEVLLVRPLLGWAKRTETEAYCRQRSVEFRIDEMNRDESFARVRVRRQLLPLLQTFNARVSEALGRSASLLREDAAALNAAAAELLLAASIEATAEREGQPSLLSVSILRAAPPALRRRALRQWLKAGRGHLRRLEMAHLLAVEGLLEGERGGRIIELPDGAVVARKRGQLEFHPEGARKTE